MKTLKVLITAGPTHEPIDPVRYLGNRSSGKMGYALAQAAVLSGAEVHLVSGPVALKAPGGLYQFTSVQTALEMHQAVMDALSDIDIFISVAAVADFRPEPILSQKHKKQPDEEAWNLRLIKNPDILADVSSSAQRPKLCVGFAAETEHAICHGKEKLKRKNVDLIAVNDVSSVDTGFESDHNALTLISKAGLECSWPKMSKIQLAQNLWAAIEMGLTIS